MLGLCGVAVCYFYNIRTTFLGFHNSIKQSKLYCGGVCYRSSKDVYHLYSYQHADIIGLQMQMKSESVQDRRHVRTVITRDPAGSNTSFDSLKITETR